MRWRGRRQSTHVEDRRGRGGFGFPGMGAPRPVKLGGGGLLLLLVLMLLLGVDPLALLGGAGGGVQVPGGGGVQVPAGGGVQVPGGGGVQVPGGGGVQVPGGGGGVQVPGGMPGPGAAAPPAAGDEGAAFVSTVLADTEETWRDLFARQGLRYREPTLVLFSGMVRSACGFAQAAMGPFYCPADQKVYIDLAFYDDLRRGFGAPGDFAQAYVIAHEVGHHVQNLLGIAEEVQRLRGRVSATQANALSVRQELQADCLAGVWGHHADRSRGLLEAGDAEEALRAAAAIGDDRIQARTQGQVVPESFTHGSGEQRVRWFRTGFESGDPDACDTFAAAEL